MNTENHLIDQTNKIFYLSLFLNKALSAIIFIIIINNNFD